MTDTSRPVFRRGLISYIFGESEAERKTQKSLKVFKNLIEDY